jgi:hypothetical protein
MKVSQMETILPIFIIGAAGIISAGLVIGAVTLLWLGGMLLWRRLTMPPATQWDVSLSERRPATAQREETVS